MDGAGGHPQQPCPTPKLLLTCHVFCYALLGLALGDGRSAVASLSVSMGSVGNRRLGPPADRRGDGAHVEALQGAFAG